MSALALVSAKGSPGVTTSALLLAAVWPQPACLLEADPRGGDLRYWQTGAAGEPLRPDLGVVSLLAARRSSPRAADGGGDGLLTHSQLLAGGLPVLVGAGTARQHQALAGQWHNLSAEINGGATAPAPLADPQAGAANCGFAVDVIVDAGGLTGDSATASLLEALPMVLLVCRPTVSSLAHTREALAELCGNGPRGAARCGVVVVGSAGDRAAVRTVLTEQRGLAELFVGHLACDAGAAQGLAGIWTRKLDRSPLVASGRRLTRQLHARLLELNAAPLGLDPLTAGAGAGR